MKNAQDRYLEDDGKLHRKLILSCEIATEPAEEPEPEDGEETKALLLHERFFNTLSFT